MKFVASILALSVPILFLSACGGGGDSSAPATPVAAVVTPAGLLPSGLDVTEFLGTWIRNDAASCYTSNEYGNYFIKNNNIVITTDSITSIATFYTDAACTLKAGKLTEVSSLTYSVASISGKTNVVGLLVSFTGSTSGADGGSGLPFNKIPDGTFSGTKVPGRTIADVDGAKLYLGAKGSPLNANGYPTTIDYSGALFFAR